MIHDPIWQENEVLEFKPSLNALHSERGSERDGIATVCAFANHKGGTLYVGVHNDGSVMGLDISEKTLREAANDISNMTTPPIIAEVRHEKMDGKSVLVIAVGRSDGRPHRYKGRPYIRSGSSTKPMPDHIFGQMLREQPAIVDFCARPIRGTSIADVHLEALAKFRHLLATRYAQKQQSADEQILSDYSILTANGELTFGGLFLLGTSQALLRHAGQAEVRYLYYRQPLDTQYAYQNRETSLQPLVLQIDNLLALIDVRSNITNVQFGLFRLEVKDFDRESMQEAILNAVIHRDYRISGHIFIRHYYETNLPNDVQLTIPSGVPEQSLFAFISKVEEQTQQYLSVLESLVALTIKEQRGATKQTIKDELKKWNIAEALTEKTVSSLVERNVLEFFGDRKARRYFLARHIYHLLGEAGELTRSLGPSSKGIEAAILDHLELYGKGTIHDFMIALSLSPNDKRQRDRVSTVLKSLKQHGIIEIIKFGGKASYQLISKNV